MKRKVSYCLAVSEEHLGDNAPILLQGGLKRSFALASEMGFDDVEIQIRYPDRFNADKLSKAAIESGIGIAAIGTGLEYSLNGLTFTSPDKNIRNETHRRFIEFIDLAAEFDAVVFLGLCRGKAPDPKSVEEYLDKLAYEFMPLVSYAEEKDVILALEPIASYLTNMLTTTKETLKFLECPDLDPIEILLDTHHMFLEDKDMLDSFRLCKGRIAHIHISDSNRRYPGSGDIDFSAVGKTLKEIDYERSVSLETLPFPSGREAAEKGIQWMRSIWGP